jgi:hypothetical protein
VDVSAASSTPFRNPKQIWTQKNKYPKRLTRGDDAKQAQINQGLPCMLLTGGCSFTSLGQVLTYNYIYLIFNILYFINFIL